MRTQLLFRVAAAALFFAACSSEDTKSNDAADFKTKAADDNGTFAAMQDEARANLADVYYFNADQDMVTITTEEGIEMIINPQNLTVRGKRVTGKVMVKFSSATSRGDQVLADLPTAGLTEVEGMDEPQPAPLFTGGEFLVDMTTEQGQPVDDGSPLTLIVPVELTGNGEGGGEGGSDGMIVWEGEEDDEGNVDWDEKEDEEGNNTEVPVVDGRYILEILTGQWCNIDKLDQIPGERTQIFVDVPDGFNDTNSSVYLSYQGFTNMLFELNTFDPNTGLFGNSYNNTPIGMTCNIIFVSQQNGQWLFGVQQVTIAGNDMITFTWSDLSTTNNAALIALLNSLP